jgi:glutathione S-transferase
LTLEQVQCAPFIIRMLALSKPENGIFSTKLPELLEKVPKFKRWAEAVVSHDTVTSSWNEKETVDKTRETVEALRSRAG